MKKNYESMKSRFTSLENQLLNTFFSGLYISANEFIALAHSVGIEMSMNSREMLIKELLNKSEEKGVLNQTVELLDALIQERIEKYNTLSRDYTGSAGILAKLSHKAMSTKSLLVRETRSNPYA